ncbi:MAG: hypothetical protein IJN13_00345 [Bacilli bacterium]|nr:hypothetical protein [Bacilli bacterium]
MIKKNRIRELNREMQKSRKKIYALATSFDVNVSLLGLKPIQPIDLNIMDYDQTNYSDNKPKSILEEEKEKFNYYRNQIMKEIDEMSNYSFDDKNRESVEGEIIVFLKDELEWKWKDIVKVSFLKYSLRQCQRKYNRAKQMSHNVI